MEQLQARGSDGDVHLVGGPQTIRAFHDEGAPDSLELVVLPFLIGDGLPLWPPQALLPSLKQVREPRTFPDGSVEFAYSTG